MTKHIHLTAEIPQTLQGLRLDQALAKLFPEYSRARLQQWIKAEVVLVNNAPAKTRMKVQGGEQVVIDTELQEQHDWQAEEIALDIIHHDNSIIVINKPPGLVVHPAPGNEQGTLVNALLYQFPELQALPRAGIVHRLDKDTSGVMVVAKSLEAHTSLVQQLSARTMKREYTAVVCGVMTAGGTVEAEIGRHPKQRTRMAVVHDGKPAVTHYRVQQRFQAHTWINLQLETGRTHQIRVHMAHIHYPILGDPVYGKRLQLPKGANENLITTLREFKRQALHAQQLTLQHPKTDKSCSFKAPIAPDMQSLINVLRTSENNE